MGYIVGIDIGGSTTKIVGLKDSEAKSPMVVKANDPLASLFGAFGKFVDACGLRLGDIDQIMLTGVGASYVSKPIYGLPTAKVEEFMANGLGGLFLSKLEKALIVSMGTGTAMVRASGGSIEHIGGTGIGGGTIIGLSSRMLNIRDIQLVMGLAESGDLSKVDLMVGDITRDEVPNLPPHTTASNFGKMSDVAAPADIALGILNMVFQSIGMSAIFAMRNQELDAAVLIGNLAAVPVCAQVFKQLSDLFGIRFVIPRSAEHATSLGAALACAYGKRHTEVPA
jgi:type II pantothenate kinase